MSSTLAMEARATNLIITLMAVPMELRKSMQATSAASPPQIYIRETKKALAGFEKSKG